MKVLKTELYDKGYEPLLNEILSGFSGERKNQLISPSDANVLVHGYENPKFQEVLDSYEYNIPDGVPSVWVAKIKGAKNIDRCSGPDFFIDVLKRTKDQQINHYFIGGKKEVLNRLEDKITNELKNQHVVGFYSPPFKDFSELEIKEMADEANSKGADFIWVGLGAPKQLYFSHTLKKYANSYYIAPVGAAFNFLSGDTKKAPKWVQKRGLEWAYRLASEPRRLAKRYFTVVPKFIYYNFKDILFSKS